MKKEDALVLEPVSLLKRIQALEGQLGIQSRIRKNTYWKSNNQPEYYVEISSLGVSVLKQIEAIKDFVGIEEIYTVYTPEKTETKIKKKKEKK